MTACQKKDAEAGFTLIETVVAMTLLAILLLALSGSIGFVGRSWDRGWRSSEQSAALARVEDTVRTLIERSFPAVARAQNKELFLFDGKAHSLRLVAYDPAGRSASGYFIQEILDDSSGGNHRLLYRHQPFTQSTGVPAASAGDVTEAPLLTGNFTFAFAYFGKPSPTSPPAWYPDWAPTQRLPDLIRLQILENAVGVWPPIIVRPMVDAEYACVKAGFSGICRSGTQTQ